MQNLVIGRERLGFKFAPIYVVLVAFMLSLAWFLVSAGQVYACKCAEPGLQWKSWGNSTRFSWAKSSWCSTPTTLKGSPPRLKTAPPSASRSAPCGKALSTKPRTSRHLPTGGSCGYTFVEGEEYIVYASDSHYGDDSYTASICSRTALLSAAQADLDALGEGGAPQAGTKGPAPEDTQNSLNAGWIFAIVLAVAVFIVGAGGIVAYAFTGRR